MTIVGANGLAEVTPDFSAQAVVRTEVINPVQSTRSLALESEVAFSVSNGWWSIELLRSYPPEASGNGESYKKIPEGVRIRPFIKGPRKGMLASEALPFAFPPPEKSDALTCWLALCPHPELPLLDKSRMRRLVQRGFVNHPKNEGHFTAEYLRPESSFLSNLTIRDDGLAVAMEGQVIQYGPPFEEGIIELEYVLLSVTNVAGHDFPQHAVLKHFSFKPNPKSLKDVYTSMETHLLVRNISPSAAHEPLVEWPPVYYALDHRFPSMTSNKTVGYVLTNDQWLSITNAEMRQLATMWDPQKPKKRPLIIVVLIFLVAAPGLLFWAYFRPKKEK